MPLRHLLGVTKQYISMRTLCTTAMRKNDNRKLDHKMLGAIRIRAVERVGAGESQEVVIQARGISRVRIYEWLAAYHEGGYEALKVKKLFGRPAKLTGKHLDRLYRIITMKNPMQLKFFYALWTRSMVREVIWDGTLRRIQ